MLIDVNFPYLLPFFSALGPLGLPVGCSRPPRVTSRRPSPGGKWAPGGDAWAKEVLVFKRSGKKKTTEILDLLNFLFVD